MPEGEGSKMPASEVAERIAIVEMFMDAAIPLSKIDKLRSRLERNNTALTDSSHMRQLVPIVNVRQSMLVSLAVKGRPVVIIFDGTPRFGELLLVLVRFWDGTTFSQRLIRLRHSSDPLDNRSLALILDCALVRVGIECKNVMAFVKDTASVNTLAVSNLINPEGCPYAHNLPCWSHTFNRIGKKLDCPLAHSFICTFSSYFSKTTKGKSEWATFRRTAEQVASRSFNKLPKTRSAVRWYNDHEITAEIIELFGFDFVRAFACRHRARRDAEDDVDEWAEDLMALETSCWPTSQRRKPHSSWSSSSSSILTTAVRLRKLATSSRATRRCYPTLTSTCELVVES